ncbi:MAG: prepilin peptidase [Candidatus Gastranaerophilales bacterium]|nr:prepilin peptidase [Candidatus Gastranaerophilales bacterium]
MINTLQLLLKESLFFYWYSALFVFIAGLCVGSFLNVVALRSLSNESIVLPPSKCPKCNHPLKWYDNIPVLSYFILLRGKCRYCSAPISIQYPIVELTTALIFTTLFMKFGATWNFILLCCLASCFIVMCITDLKEQVIFDNISIPVIPIGLFYSFFNIGNFHSGSVNVFNTGIYLQNSFISSLAAVFIALLFFEIISFLSKLFIKHRAFGEGDTIIAMGIGAWFGVKILIITIILSFITQVVATLPLVTAKLIKNKNYNLLQGFGLLIISLIVAVTSNILGVTETHTGAVITLVITIIAALYGTIKIFSNLDKTNLTMLPFGPALIAAAFLAVFFTDYCVDIIYTFLR